LRVLRVTGAQLRAFLEHSARYYRSLDANGAVPVGGLIDAAIPGFNFDVVSGADYSIDLRQPVGQRIGPIRVSGREVSATDTFTLALNNYRAGGGGGFSMLAGAPVVWSREIDIRQLIIDEVTRAAAAGKALDPRDYAARNWSLQPATAISAAYAEQNRGRAAESGGRPPSRELSAKPTAHQWHLGRRFAKLLHD